MPDQTAAPYGSLVCTMLYEANAGYAWRYIERLNGLIADALAARGVPTYIAYPAIAKPPALELVGTSGQPKIIDFNLGSPRALLAQFRFLRAHRVRAMYRVEHNTYSWRHALYRLAGVRWIVVHSHASGFGRPASGLARLAKLVRARLPWVGADAVVTVSDFVARRERETALTPASRVMRIWNAVALPSGERAATDRAATRQELGVPDSATVVVMTARATKDKGVHHLLRAFDQVVRETGRGPDELRLVFVGGGWDFDEFSRLASELPSRDQITLTGATPRASRYLAGGDIACVPSVFQDAFPLSVLEAMSYGLPVVASQVGGIPEAVRDGEEGLLVPAEDEPALATALRRLVENPDLARAMGARARARAAEQFDGERMLHAVVTVVGRPFPI